ncbi:hypothetical protein RM553_19235 [Zunongwangia sp. F363]|uniref:Uncharacterized protein n=1 Tax=Autumnicola tepida TaxID=3075595 RepID=A0ABU3CF44_9FLAO|nr:hypothetical protein [Zunongwangia sp. F363]MDT0644975.1 hypothetical protein [Zunongwangia sp. F363]
MKYKPGIASTLIIVTFVTGIMLGFYVQRFRISDYRWIYQYGSYLNLVMVFGSISYSFYHALVIITDKKITPKKKLLWILIGSIPFLYFAFRMVSASI